jgi:hypothetical protein
MINGISSGRAAVRLEIVGGERAAWRQVHLRDAYNIAVYRVKAGACGPKRTGGSLETAERVANRFIELRAKEKSLLRAGRFRGEALQKVVRELDALVLSYLDIDAQGQAMRIVLTIDELLAGSRPATQVEFFERLHSAGKEVALRLNELERRQDDLGKPSGENYFKVFAGQLEEHLALAEDYLKAEARIAAIAILKTAFDLTEERQTALQEAKFHGPEAARANQAKLARLANIRRRTYNMLLFAATGARG